MSTYSFHSLTHLGLSRVVVAAGWLLTDTEREGGDGGPQHGVLVEVRTAGADQGGRLPVRPLIVRGASEAAVAVGGVPLRVSHG